ncbi:amidohydrolase family protein [Acidobacteria bacterium AH-259-D05]|nr:amidohydrolase family protein [Acidobacteria bacterium AH-259-D05]
MKRLIVGAVITYIVLGVMPGMAQGTQTQDQSSSATLILHNGKIVTVDADFRVLEAVAVGGDTILRVGSNEEILQLANQNALKIDLKGRTVIPGLIDTHVHFDRFTWEQFSDEYPETVGRYPIYMKDVRDRQGVLKQIENTISRYRFQPGEWIFFILKDFQASRHANIWYNELTRWELDRVSPHNPIILPGGGFPDSGGLRLNSLGIQQLWDKHGPFVERYGRYWTDPSGQPTGMIEPPANRLVLDEFRPRSDPEKLAPLAKKRLAHWSAMGVTTGSTRMVQDYVQAYQILEARGELPVRIGYGISDSSFVDPEGVFRRLGNPVGQGSNEVWVVSVSLQSLDGSGTRECTQTSRLTPWPGQDWFPVGGCYLEPEYRGARAPGISRGNYYKEYLMTMARHSLRWANTHVAGDLAHKQVLDILEEIEQERPGFIALNRWSMDHCRLVDPADIPRMAKVGVMMSCQPGVVRSASSRAKIYGEEIAHNWSSPVKSMLDAGVKVVFESDTRGNIWEDFARQITRQDDQGKVWGSHERVDRVTALKMITRWAGEYLLKEDLIGSIEEEKFGDFIVLDRDYMSIPEDEIADIKVLMTFKGGQMVFIETDAAKEYNLHPSGAVVGTLDEL